MEQNNLNTPVADAVETREPLPTFDENAGREPLPTLDFSADAPNGDTMPELQMGNNAEVFKLVDSAFGKCLAAAIMAWFPITSIIAIVLGSKGLKLVKQANELAERYGISAGGKNTAAKVLGLIGKIAGIVYTVIWAIYGVILGFYLILYFFLIFGFVFG